MSNTEPLTGAHLLQYLRERCENDFTFFARYFFKHRKGTKFVWNDHHTIMCDDLMRVWRGDDQNLIENVPPRYTKTELFIILFVAWCYAKNPRCEFIHLSYADPLVMENSDAIKDIIKSYEYRQLWPHIVIRPNRDSKRAWDTAQGGKFYATAAGGQVTGFGAGRLDEVNAETGEFTFSGCLLIDDPLKPDDALSDPLREAVNKRWDTTIKSRRNSPRTPTILIMQRIHEQDFTATLLADTEHVWKHRSMPALIDEGLPTERALWPAKHSVTALQAMKKKNSYVHAAQYQQRPSPLGGGLLKGAWFPRMKVFPQIRYRKIYVDTAQKTKERNDYSVFECWGAGVDGKIYLLDLLRGKWEAPELKRTAIEFWNKHKAVTVIGQGALREMMIEDKASGTGLIQEIKRGGRIPVKGIERSIDKLTRVMDGAPFIEAGYAVLYEDAPYVSEFVTECEAFTADDTHAHDDQIDPMLDAIADMLGRGNGLLINEELLRRA